MRAADGWHGHLLKTYEDGKQHVQDAKVSPRWN